MSASSNTQALNKKFTDLSVDIYNLLQQYHRHSAEGAEKLEVFLNSRASTSSEQVLFAAEKAVRTINTLNDLVEKKQKIVGKLRKAEQNVKAMTHLLEKSINNTLTEKINVLSRILPTIATELERDFQTKFILLQRSPLTSHEEAMVTVSLWRESYRLYNHFSDDIYALTV